VRVKPGYSANIVLGVDYRGYHSNISTPSLAIPGVVSVKCEDIFIVRGVGAEKLTSYDREIIKIIGVLSPKHKICRLNPSAAF